MIKNLLQEGFALKSKGHYKHAIEVFYKALELDNTSTELLLELADLYLKLGNEEKALSYIDTVLEKNPAHIEALKFLKNIFISKNAWQEAEQTAKNIYCVSRSGSDLAEIFKLLIKQNKFDEIFEYNADTNDFAVVMEIARAYYYKKEFQKALDILLPFKDENQNNEDFLLILGQIYYALNQKDKCFDFINRFKDLTAEKLNFIGLVETYRENFQTAIASFLGAIKKERSNSDYYFNLANAYYKKGDLDFAKKYYNTAISIAPENQTYHFALANLYYSEKHYKKALEELVGDFFEARFLKSVILYETGYLALARKELRDLQTEYPEREMVAEYLSRINSELGLN